MLQYCLTHISAKWNFSLSTTFKSLVKTITLLKGFEVSTKGFKRLYFCRYFCKFLFQYQSPHTVSEFSMQNQAPAQCEVVAPNSLMLRFFYHVVFVPLISLFLWLSAFLCYVIAWYLSCFYSLCFCLYFFSFRFAWCFSTDITFGSGQNSGVLAAEGWMPGSRNTLTWSCRCLKSLLAAFGSSTRSATSCRSPVPGCLPLILVPVFLWLIWFFLGVAEGFLGFSPIVTLQDSGLECSENSLTFLRASLVNPR